MSVLNEVAAKVAALTGLTVGTTIFHGSMPATPDAVCAIYETGGLAPQKAMGTATLAWQNPTVQVVFRGAPRDYSGPRALAKTAYLGLAAVEAETLSGILYHEITPMQEPFAFSRDGNERVLVACNYLCQKEPS